MKKLCVLFIVLVFISINVRPGILSGSALFRALEKDVRGDTTDEDLVNNQSYVLSAYHSVEGVFACAPVNTNEIEMKQVVLGYMQRHPEQWSKSADVTIVNALIDAWPCKSK
ncbi:Rap1a/Tai family immunity protein [Undibacterium sp. SXout7W]|uniref:Rap1a/Tai family immunity protein n=1 Tax=Undibacterium sp. SXout7W TaxID=3413049 RepID=UPI003BF2B1AA